MALNSVDKFRNTATSPRPSSRAHDAIDFIEGRAHSGHADGVARDRDWRPQPTDVDEMLLKGILARMLALTGGFSVELPGIEPTVKKA